MQVAAPAAAGLSDVARDAALAGPAAAPPLQASAAAAAATAIPSGREARAQAVVAPRCWPGAPAAAQAAVPRVPGRLEPVSALAARVQVAWAAAAAPRQWRAAVLAALAAKLAAMWALEPAVAASAPPGLAVGHPRTPSPRWRAAAIPLRGARNGRSPGTATAVSDAATARSAERGPGGVRGGVKPATGADPPQYRRRLPDPRPLPTAPSSLVLLA